MRLAVITPTRGAERIDFVTQAKKLISAQTRRPYNWYLVDYEANPDGSVDMIDRIRKGLEQARADGATHVAFWEDDDYYRADYLANLASRMTDETLLLGCSYMSAYHLGFKRWGMEYQGRDRQGASLHRMVGSVPYMIEQFSPLNISKALSKRMTWLDIYLWDKAGKDPSKFRVVDTELFDCISMKHGVGKCGSSMHGSTNRSDQVLKYPDKDLYWLKKFTGEHFPFYRQQVINLTQEVQAAI